MESVTCIIRGHQLRLCGHLARFPVDDPAHQIVFTRLSCGSMGRPRKAWLGQLDQTSREELEIGLGHAWLCTPISVSLFDDDDDIYVCMFIYYIHITVFGE